MKKEKLLVEFDSMVLAFIGRALTDRVMDVSLVMLFGGNQGGRFSRLDRNRDGAQDMSRSTSGEMALTTVIFTRFPCGGNL